jgi:hypothetical protein
MSGLRYKVQLRIDVRAPLAPDYSRVHSVEEIMMTRRAPHFMSLATALAALAAGAALTPGLAATSNVRSVGHDEMREADGLATQANRHVVVGEDLMGFIVTESAGGVMLAQHASHASHASHSSHSSHYSSR